MSLNWVDLLANPGDLRALYGTPPALRAVTVRSVHLNHDGPALTLRLDLPAFPGSPPREWREAGFDRFQCHLQFLAVESLAMRGWNPPATADIGLDACDRRRMRVTVESSSFDLSFEAADTVLVGHLSAFSPGEDGSDGGSRGFLGKLDSLRFDTLPGLEEKTFYERV
ncbi:Imm50 family immunity protein [Streptomyces zaomyceticus]|uniref:Imm50 family immunity protein n=1 Tax=Streptomyces zaomyceticus TaxID=68286 RepID=UPI002E22305B